MSEVSVSVDVAASALRSAGHEVGHILGRGTEGVVVELGDAMVAKIWRSASMDRLRLLQHFYESVDLGRVATPRIVDLIPLAPSVISIEGRLPGRPLRDSMENVEYEVNPDDLSVITSTLGALMVAPRQPDQTILPLLPDTEIIVARPATFEADLARLVVERTDRFRHVLAADLADLDRLVELTCSALLETLSPRRSLVHGDLMPGNLLVHDDLRSAAVLDFGFLSTVGDPAFDAAVAASVYDLWGPHARRNERDIDHATIEAFGHDQQRLHVYRAAYALATSNCFSHDGSDGHYGWCVSMLRRSDVRAAIAG